MQGVQNAWQGGTGHRLLEDRPVGVDNKGISPLPHSPKDREGVSKERVGFEVQQRSNLLPATNDIIMLQKTMDMLEQQQSGARHLDGRSDYAAARGVSGQNLGPG